MQMFYGIQEHFLQIYDTILPRLPPLLFSNAFIQPATLIAAIVLVQLNAGPLTLTNEQTKLKNVELMHTWNLFKKPVLIFGGLFCVSQALKVAGFIPSIVGSAVGLLSVAVMASKVHNINVANAGDKGILAAYAFAGLMIGAFQIAFCQFIMKNVKTDLQLCLWFIIWNIYGEVCMAYWRMCMRRLDLRVCDSSRIALLSITPMVIMICGKRTVLLCLTDNNLILFMNIFTFFLEVINRIGVAWRDKQIDMYLRGMSSEEAEQWKNPLHRQTYMHCEMIQETLEFVFPLPLTAVMYLVQYSPKGEAVALATLMSNGMQQIVQEFFADAVAIWYGSRKQEKYYRAAYHTLHSGDNKLFLLFAVSLTVFAASGILFSTYLRVGQNLAGDFVTFI